jgi:hypothetical protein
VIDSALRRKSKFVVTPKGDSASPDRWFGTFRYHWYFILIFGGSIAAGFIFGHSHPAMIIWATFATAITATPIVVWRLTLRQEKKKLAAGPAEPQDAVPVPQPFVPAQPTPQAPHGSQPSHAPHAPHSTHAPQHKPRWAASGGTGGGSVGSEGNDQTMQIALGGHGGRKE